MVLTWLQHNVYLKIMTKMLMTPISFTTRRLFSKRITSRACLKITEFCNFAEVTLEEIQKFSRKPLSKSCELDPLPAVVLKGYLTVLLPTITRIINLSLSTGVAPDALKVATLLPTLKKTDADFEQFQNFRPISNLKVVSKLVEKAVAIQVTDHVMAHHLDEMFQSAYKNFHSTETALVRVQNDILRVIDNNESVILLLLDLSAMISLWLSVVSNAV